MNINHENNRVITTEKGKGKLPLFSGNVERVIPIYAQHIQNLILSMTEHYPSQVKLPIHLLALSIYILILHLTSKFD